MFRRAFFLFLVISLGSVAAETDPADVAALNQFAASVSNLPWPSAEGADPCVNSWLFVRCDLRNGTHRIVEILIPAADLVAKPSGSIPNEIGNFTELKVLALDSMALYGTHFILSQRTE